MAVRLSALRTGRALLPQKYSGTHFCYRLSKPHSHGGVCFIFWAADSVDVHHKLKQLENVDWIHLA
jgi:hypothetical protein